MFDKFLTENCFLSFFLSFLFFYFILFILFYLFYFIKFVQIWNVFRHFCSVVGNNKKYEEYFGKFCILRKYMMLSLREPKTIFHIWHPIVIQWSIVSISKALLVWFISFSNGLEVWIWVFFFSLLYFRGVRLRNRPLSCRRNGLLVQYWLRWCCKSA